MVFYADGRVSVEDADGSLEWLQKKVEGFIVSIVSPYAGLTLYGNDDALYAGPAGEPLPVNQIITKHLAANDLLMEGYSIHGNVVAVGIDQFGRDVALGDEFMRILGKWRRK